MEEVKSDLRADSVEAIALENLDPNCKVKTDNFTSNSKLNKVVKNHTAKTIKPKDAGNVRNNAGY